MKPIFLIKTPRKIIDAKTECKKEKTLEERVFPSRDLPLPNLFNMKETEFEFSIKKSSLLKTTA